MTSTFGLGLLALAFVLPAQYLPWPSFHLQWLAALGCALLVLGIAFDARRARQPARVPALALLAFASALVPLLQGATGQLFYRMDIVLPALFLAGFGLAIVAGATAAALDRDRWLDGLMTALLVAAALSVALASVQWLDLFVGALWIKAVPPGGRPFANLGQPNQLATLLGLGLAAIVHLRARGRFGDVGAAALAAWLGFGLLMSQSRTGALIVGWLAIWGLFMHRRAGLPWRPRVFAIAAALFAIGWLAWTPLNEAIGLTHAQSLQSRLDTGPRLRIWQAMAAAVAQSPLVGYGWNQVPMAQQLAALAAPPVGFLMDSAHNVWLDLAVWAGAPFALLWLAVTAVWWLRRARAVDGPAAWAALAAITVVLLHAQLEHPLSHAYFLLPMGLLMGALSARPKPATHLPWPALAVPTALTVVALFGIGAEYLRVEHAQRELRLQLMGVGIGRVARTPAPEVMLLDSLRDVHRFMATPAGEDMDRAAVDWMRRVSLRQGHPPFMMRFAIATGLAGRGDEALLTLARLCRMHHPDRCDEARQSWDAARSRWPALPPFEP